MIGTTPIVSILCVLAAAISPTAAPAQTTPAAPALPTISDDEIWNHFAKWAAELKPLPPGHDKNERNIILYYRDALVTEGVDKEEAIRRARRMNALRRGSVERERIFWNGSFKLGTGPAGPLRLLEEAIRKVKPGRSLDAGMGGGRNTIYLAANGWDSHGYDMSEEAITAAQAGAKEAGVAIATVLAEHAKFDFGDSQWDLILCSYCGMSPTDLHWSGVILKALKPGGLAIFQEFVATRPDWTKLSDTWKAFHILRLEDEDPGYIDTDWNPSLTNRTIMVVARKE